MRAKWWGSFLLIFLWAIAHVSAGNAKALLENRLEPGKDAWLLISVPLDKGEHAYGTNPGESGFPPSIEWQLPSGVRVEELRWEAPKRFTFLGQSSFGYENRMRLFARLAMDAEVEEESLGSLSLAYLACTEVDCQPRSVQLAIVQEALEVSKREERKKREAFHRAWQAMARENAEIQAFVKGKRSIDVYLPSRIVAGKAIDVIPETAGWVSPQQSFPLSEEGGVHILHIPLLKSFNEDFTAVLRVGGKPEKLWALNKENLSPPIEGSAKQSYLWLLSLAFLGGLLLNVMPCVLPVVSLKMLSFAQIAEKKQRKTLRYSLLFAGGIFASFWLLSILLISLQSAGQQVGWGFQFQEPGFLTFLILLFFFMALSLLGVFELGVRASRLANLPFLKGSGGVFLGGMFTTLVATPCTGPLLGPVLGVAMTAPPWTMVAVLTAMGAGLSSPYIVFALFPSSMSLLPRPGSWMSTFKQALGFLLLAVVLWLLWTLSFQTASNSFIFVALFGLLALALAAWSYGKSQSRKRVKTLIFRVLCLCLLGLSGALANEGYALFSKPKQSLVEPFSEQKLQAYLQEGKSVFVEYTARWCLICQANKIVLDSQAVQDLFKSKQVVHLRADWTGRDAAISESLQGMNRSSVPLYVLHRKHGQKKIFSQILSQSEILKEVNQL